MGDVQSATSRAMDAASLLRLVRLLLLLLLRLLSLLVLLLLLLLHGGQFQAAVRGIGTSGAGSRQGCDVSRSRRGDDATGSSPATASNLPGAF